jgi:hypothetical protein
MERLIPPLTFSLTPGFPWFYFALGGNDPHHGLGVSTNWSFVFVLEFNGNITSLGEVRNAEKTKPTNLEPGTEILLLIQHSKFEVCSLLYLLCWKRGGIFRQ